MPKLNFLTLSLGFIFLCSNSVIAQPAIEAQNNEQKDHLYFSIWSGYSSKSLRLFGKTPNAKSRIIGLGFRKKIKSYSSGLDIYYTADIIPQVFYDYPKRDNNDRMTIRRGVGVSPVGFLFRNPINSHIIMPYFQGAGSVIFMNKNFPTDKGTRFNYTFEITTGFSIKVMKHFGISLGYKFHHISNAETGSENPGLDSNFLFISLISY